MVGNLPSEAPLAACRSSDVYRGPDLDIRVQNTEDKVHSCGGGRGWMDGWAGGQMDRERQTDR